MNRFGTKVTDMNSQDIKRTGSVSDFPVQNASSGIQSIRTTLEKKIKQLEYVLRETMHENDLVNSNIFVDSQISKSAAHDLQTLLIELDTQLEVIQISLDEYAKSHPFGVSGLKEMGGS